MRPKLLWRLWSCAGSREGECRGRGNQQVITCSMASVLAWWELPLRLMRLDGGGGGVEDPCSIDDEPELVSSWVELVSPELRRSACGLGFEVALWLAGGK
jgi:hypothetical protein